MAEPKRAKPPKAAVEPKVKTATGAGAAASFVLWVLGEYLFNGAVPDPVEAVVMFLVPAIVVFVTAWATRHQYRPEPPHPEAAS